MLTLGHLAFVAPSLLGFFVALPILWLLLRLTPPSPKKIVFPALALLKGLKAQEETPARSPWWLLLLRLAIASLLIVAFAKPLIDPVPVIATKGTLLIAVDNDWAAARDWQQRQIILRTLLRDAKHEQRQVMILATTPSSNGEPLAVAGPLVAEAAQGVLDQVTPEPWPADWLQAASALKQIDGAGVSDAVWLASGLGSIDANAFYDELQKIAPTKVYGSDMPIYDVLPPVSEGEALSIAVMRAATEGAATVALNAEAKDGNILAHWPVNFTEGSPRVVVPLDMPPELRNRVVRFDLEGQRTAGAAALLDAAWEHRSVGIVGDANELDRHSLLSEVYYIDRALKPFADIHVGSFDVLMKQNPPVLILTDSSAVGSDDVSTLSAWLKRGGVLVRFVGERFAASDDPTREAALLPVPLRAGGRSLDGALTWGSPQKLEPFPENSPFHNLPVPDDVTVSRQILAEPSPDLASKTWAALTDGTPLVTAANVGQGVSIMFHVPARSSWSNLPISGLFVDMLQRILRLSRADHATGAAADAGFAPLSTLDAFGEQHAAGVNVLPLAADAVSSTSVAPQHPPGLYGTDANSVALNLGFMVGQPEALHNVPVKNFTVKQSEIDLQPYLLIAAFLLMLVDFLVSLRLRGFLKFAAFAFVLFGFMASPHAATEAKIGIELTSKTYLAFVRTGDPEVDRVSELGLRGLASVLQNRTSVDEVGVAKVDPDQDDLAFFPLVYWPVVPGEHPVSAEGARRVNYYLQHGGMILFDAVSSEGAAPGFLQEVLAGVDLPPLVRLPENHVLKRTFYLLDEFPGRFTGHDFWIEPEEASAYDGVASVMFGSNGWAAAWAMDDAGRPLYPCTPDGEPQRERAFRFGVNLVLYALTGNYKNDQLHATALLERMHK